MPSTATTWPQRTFDDDCVLARGRRSAAFEERAEPFDEIGWPISKVEQGPFLDLAVDPIALAHQNGGQGVAPRICTPSPCPQPSCSGSMLCFSLDWRRRLERASFATRGRSLPTSKVIAAAWAFSPLWRPPRCSAQRWCCGWGCWDRNRVLDRGHGGLVRDGDHCLASRDDLLAAQERPSKDVLRAFFILLLRFNQYGVTRPSPRRHGQGRRCHLGFGRDTIDLASALNRFASCFH